MEYWIRSLVPILKKSTSLAMISAVIAAEGTSIIAPTSIESLKARPFSFSSFLHSSSRILAWRSSSIPEIIGYISFRLPCTEALNIALSWILNISGRARQKRIALQPKKGDISRGISRCDKNLSPPKSNVRIITGLSLTAWATNL